MTIARSSFSVSRILPFYRNLLRRYRGSAFFYGALGFISLPVQYLLAILQNRGNPMDTDWISWTFTGPAMIYNGFAAFFFTALMLVAPLIMAANLFSYLHSKRAVDVYHALPLTRAELYAACCKAGITLIWMPLIFNFLLTALFSLMLPGASVGMILLELLCWMVITLSIFSITAFCAVQLGTDFDTVIFSLGLNGVFAAVYLMFIMLADGFIYGFSASDSVMRFAYRLSPVSLMIGRIALSSDSSAEYIAENNVSMLAWLLISLVVLLAGCWRYLYRRSEQAETVGEMGPLQVFMRSAASLLGGTGLGVILCAVFDVQPQENHFLSLFCIAVGSVIIYFIGDVILTRSVRSIPKALPVAVLTAAGVCVAVGAVMFDLFGIGRWVPAQEKVDEAKLYYYESRFSEQPSLPGQDPSVIAFEDPEAVALVIAAQQTQIDWHDKGETTYYGGSLRISYDMQDGRTVTRRYSNLAPATLEQLLKLEVDDELVTQQHPAFAADAEMIDGVSITNLLGNREEILSLSREQKESLLSALREDLLDQPLEELSDGTLGICTLSINYWFQWESDEYFERHPDLDPYTYATSRTLLTESYDRTLALLREFGAESSLENDWSTVKAAYAFPFNRGYSQNTVSQTNLDRVIQTQEDIQIFFDDRELSKKWWETFSLSKSQLNALRGSLCSSALSYGEPYAAIGIAAGDSPQTITGYCLAPVALLPEETRQAVVKMVEYYYGSYAIDAWGYREFVTEEEPADAEIVVDTVALGG